MPALVHRLEAIKFWTRKEGRLAADIDWTVSIRSDFSFTPSALPYSPKKERLALPEKITVKWLWENLPIGYYFSGIAILLFFLIIGICISETNLYQQTLKSFLLELLGSYKNFKP
jgi:hypothetical protein